jgi:hypothetical protein
VAMTEAMPRRLAPMSLFHCTPGKFTPLQRAWKGTEVICSGTTSLLPGLPSSKPPPRSSTWRLTGMGATSRLEDRAPLSSSTSLTANMASMAFS